MNTLCKTLTLNDIVSCKHDENTLTNLITQYEHKLQNFKQKYLDELDKSLLDNPTYETLCSHLISTKYDKIEDFILKYYHSLQKRFEPQESIFRLFGILGLYDDFKIKTLSLSNDFYISQGNFSGRRNITVSVQPSEILTSKLKDKGDISDLTFISKYKYIVKNNELIQNDKKGKRIIIACSSKNPKNIHTHFDLDQIKGVFDEYYDKDYLLHILLVMPNKHNLQHKIDRMATSSMSNRDILQNASKTDWDVLNKTYRKFDGCYVDTFKNNDDKPKLQLRPHQQ